MKRVLTLVLALLLLCSCGKRQAANPYLEALKSCTTADRVVLESYAAPYADFQPETREITDQQTIRELVQTLQEGVGPMEDERLENAIQSPRITLSFYRGEEYLCSCKTSMNESNGQSRSYILIHLGSYGYLHDFSEPTATIMPFWDMARVVEEG